MSSAAVARAGEATAAATLGVSFHGLDHFDQRTANGGNQFSVEPPDQGLCVGNGFIMETVNDVIQVFDTVREPGHRRRRPEHLLRLRARDQPDHRTSQGPFVTDPSCLYDADVNRWFHVVLTLEIKRPRPASSRARTTSTWP